MNKKIAVIFFCAVLSGCGLAQSHCLAPCLDSAIAQHVQDGIDQGKDNIGRCDLRDMVLLREVVRCKVKCQ